MPAYNCADTITESVDSIFNGNFLDGDEVIIVNDGSTDDTAIIIDSLVKKYSPKIISVSNQNNIGCPASRNIGIRLAKNDLIFNLDADNVLVSGSVQKLKQAIFLDNAQAASFQEYWYFKKNTKEVTHKWICRSGIFELSDLLAGFYNPASGGNYLYKKNFWQKIGGYWEYGKGLHEAWGFTLKLLANGAKFIVVPNTYYFHRYSHESLFVRENKKKNEAVSVTGKFIEPILPLLSESSRKYVKDNPDWFDHLSTRSLILKGCALGKNGKMKYTSILKQAAYILLNLISKR